MKTLQVNFFMNNCLHNCFKIEVFPYFQNWYQSVNSQDGRDFLSNHEITTSFWEYYGFTGEILWLIPDKTTLLQLFWLLPYCDLLTLFLDYDIKRTFLLACL